MFKVKGKRSKVEVAAQHNIIISSKTL